MFKKAKRAFSNNRKLLLKIGVLATYYTLAPQIGFAAAGQQQLPGMSVLDNVIYWVTGPVPAAVATIAIGTAGALATFGELGPVAKRGMQIVGGASFASQAPNIVGLFGINITGLFF